MTGLSARRLSGVQLHVNKEVVMNLVTERLEKLGIKLPHPAAPVANYVPFTRAGALLFVSGQLPFNADGKISPAHVGKLGPHSSIEVASAAARLCAINLIAQAHAAAGDLDRIARVVRLGGFFNVETSFDALSQAMNGASDLMAAAFDERGRHARTAVGVSHLPFNALVEIEAIFEVDA
jgi:enamine deaminase RidA (YjgF/YER057c/UK114 family)